MMNRTRKLVVGLGMLVLFAGVLVVARAVAIRLDLVPNPDQYQGLAGLSEFHRVHESALDDFADRFEQDADFVEVLCDASWMEARQAGADAAEPMTDQYREIYGPLCQFTPKLSAERTQRGVRFPQFFYEYGDLFVLVYLERRSTDDIYQQCDADAFSVSRGMCDVSLGDGWSVTYAWEPFCKEGMEDELQCE